ncbi:MAG: hypothetical protein LBO06_00190 [Bacteroidales bacterium]|jgi:hypothetical protein|nr:hypothetical protein [Bacteroidales bacterium]
MKKLFLAIAVLSIAFSSCTDEQDFENQSASRNHLNKSISSSNPTLKNYLTFSSFEELDVAIKDLNAMDEASVVAWENSHNFVSLNRISDEVDLAEDMLNESVYDSLSQFYSESQIENMKFDERHSALFDEFSHLFIKRIMEDDGGIYYDLDINYNDYASIVNADGIVKVDDKIYQFKDSTTKVIEDGDASKISLLKHINETDTVRNIKVFHLHKTLGDIVIPPAIRDLPSHPFEYMTYKTRSKYKVLMYNKFEQYYSAQLGTYVSTYSIRGRSLKKGLFAYNNYTTTMVYSGRFTGTEGTYGYYFTSGHISSQNPSALHPSRIYENRNWTLSNQYKSKKSHTLDKLFFDYTEQSPHFCSAYSIAPPYNLNTTIVIPQIYGWNHTMTANGSSNISFTTSY